MKKIFTRNNQINFFQRKSRPGQNFSLEQIFDGLRSKISSKYAVKLFICPKYSMGILPRIINILYVYRNKGIVNHITGDVNYVNLLLPKKNTILTVLDAGILYQLSGVKKFLVELFWYRIPMYKAKYITVISEATKTDMQKLSPKLADRFKVIYVPIDAAFVSCDKTFNKSNPIILQIGAAPNKNLVNLIKASIDLKVTLYIIGEISAENWELLKEHKIDYINKIGIPFEEVVEAYQNCDILYFASTFEGFGMPILEAQATGRPVITSNLTSMPEVGGNAVHYVDPYSVDEIREAIILLIENDAYRQDLVSKGFENVKRFDADFIASQYCELYDEIIAENTN